MNIAVGKYIYDAVKLVSRSLYVYPVVAMFDNETPLTPFAVYQRTGMSPGNTKDLYDNSITHTFAITIYDNDYSNTAALVESVIDALLALSHTTQNDMQINQVVIADLQEDFINGLFSQTLTIEINTTEI